MICETCHMSQCDTCQLYGATGSAECHDTRSELTRMVTSCDDCRGTTCDAVGDDDDVAEALAGASDDILWDLAQGACEVRDSLPRAHLEGRDVDVNIMVDALTAILGESASVDDLTVAARDASHDQLWDLAQEASEVLRHRPAAAVEGRDTDMHSLADAIASIVY